MLRKSNVYLVLSNLETKKLFISWLAISFFIFVCLYALSFVHMFALFHDSFISSLIHPLKLLSPVLKIHLIFRASFIRLFQFSFIHLSIYHFIHLYMYSFICLVPFDLYILANLHKSRKLNFKTKDN